MENLDLKLINILINNRKELADFTSSAAEGIFEQEYKRFVKTLISYYNNYTSPPTLNTILEFCGNNSNLKDYISSIWEKADQIPTDPKEYSFILDKINKRYNMVVLTSVREKLNNIEDLEEANKFLYKATNEIQSIGESKLILESTLIDSANDYFQKFKAKQQNKELNEGIKFGYSIFDHYTNGLMNSELAIVIANTGCGKSIFMLDVALHAWIGKNKFPSSKEELNTMVQNGFAKGANVLYFSLEMTDNEIKDRIISNLCEIDSLDLMKGNVNVEQAEKMSLALNFWKKYNYNFKIVDAPSGCTMQDIQSVFDETSKEFKIDFVIIDYLSLIKYKNSTGDENQDWLNLIDLSKEVYQFARANNVPVLSALQSTLTQEGKGGVGLHRIARSRGISANVSILLQIEDRVDEKKLPDARIHCLKFRRGATFTMNNLLKAFNYSKFVDQPISSNVMEQQQQTNLSEDDLSSSIDDIFGVGDVSLD